MNPTQLPEVELEEAHLPQSSEAHDRITEMFAKYKANTVGYI